MKEYVIWGKDANNHDEVLLLCKVNGGKTIKSVKEAEHYINYLKKHGCYDMRIQEVNLEDNNFGFDKTFKN